MNQCKLTCFMYYDTEWIEDAWIVEMPLDEPFDITFCAIIITSKFWGELSKSSEFFLQPRGPSCTLTVSCRTHLCVSQVHEFSLMHRPNYSATKLHTVNVNYSSSNNRWWNIVSARWQAPLWTATALQINSGLHYYYSLFYLPFPTMEKIQQQKKVDTKTAIIFTEYLFAALNGSASPLHAQHVCVCALMAWKLATNILTNDSAMSLFFMICSTNTLVNSQTWLKKK